jgi:protoheme IX farnesyltransferase
MSTISTARSSSAVDRSARPGWPAIYASLTKARLSAMVLLTTLVGFVLATPTIDWTRLAWTILGTGLAACAANVLNQLWEIRRDARMHRTLGRPLPAGHISARHAFIAGVVLAYAGVAVLALLVNLTAAAIAFVNILAYVFVYTPLKTRTTLNTLVGAICGALPPIIGWVAAGGSLSQLTPGGWALALVLFVWQIPHFLALAWMYRRDYRRGGYQMLPVIDTSGGMTGRVIVLSTLLLVPVGLVAVLAGLAGWIYAVGSVVLGLLMIVPGIMLCMQRSDVRARRLFLASLVYLPVLLGLMVVDRVDQPVVTAPGVVVLGPGLAPIDR